MKRRQKILLVILLGAVGLFAGGDPLIEMFSAPVRQREQRAAALQRKVDKLDAEYAKVQSAQRKLNAWATRSLPPDASRASILYHDWLLKLVENAKLTQVVVTPERVVPQQNAYLRIPYRIEAHARSETLCELLSTFDRTDVLHRMTRLHVDAISQDQADPELRVEMQIEALALLNAPSGQIPSGVLQSTISPDERSSGTFQGRNLFVRGYHGPPPPPVVEPVAAVPQIDNAAQIYLIASLDRGERREAWLYDRMRKQPILLHETESFRAGEVRGAVRAIARDSVLLEIDDKTWRLDLGKNLRQLKACPKIVAQASHP
jgi:hypothetical protein